MIATTGLSDTQWAWLTVAAVAVLAGPLVRAVIVEWRNTTEEPLRPLGYWPDDVHVHIPGIGGMPAKRRVKGCGPERLKAGDISWMFRPDDTVSWQGQPIPEAPARFTPRRIPTPAPPPALPAQLWGDLGPAIQPTPAVWVVPALRPDPRQVWVPAPLEEAS